jgi:hypothetical protein
MLVIAISSSALADDRCVGAALPGALVGLFVADYAVVGGYKLAGADLHSPHPWLLTGTSFVGLTAGPIAACALFGHERHAIPAASFVIDGAVLGGGTAFALVLRAVAPQISHDHRCGSTDCGGDGAMGLAGLAMLAGATAGGIGGYYLHGAVFGHVTPIASRDVVGVSIGTRF